MFSLHLETASTEKSGNGHRPKIVASMSKNVGDLCPKNASRRLHVAAVPLGRHVRRCFHSRDGPVRETETDPSASAETLNLRWQIDGAVTDGSGTAQCKQGAATKSIVTDRANVHALYGR